VGVLGYCVEADFAIISSDLFETEVGLVLGESSMIVVCVVQGCRTAAWYLAMGIPASYYVFNT
jgi:hypothetical protein